MKQQQQKPSRFLSTAFRKDLEHYFEEDDHGRNFYYLNELPEEMVECQLRFKSDMVIAGMPFFVEAFRYLGVENESLYDLLTYEGQCISGVSKTVASFKLPFATALTGERVALNLLQHLSGIASVTKEYVSKAQKFNIAILDTRKTLPGLRSLQKYAVRVGGGKNHRFSQNEAWMVKDNHKSFFGGLPEAVAFFEKMGCAYTPVIVEIHSLTELKQAINLKIRYALLDNFSPELLIEAIKIKPDFMYYELSGGITLDSLEKYLIEGVDAISVGQLTSGLFRADISLKYGRSIQ